MAVKLRTRLFLTVATVLALSIAASALLSRRATLVEVHEVVSKPLAVRAPDLAAIAGRVQAHLGRRGREGLAAVLSSAAQDGGWQLIVIDDGRHVVAGSRPDLATARVRRAAEDGDLALDIDVEGGRTALSVRGAPPVTLREANGQPLYLYVLPAPGGPQLPLSRLLLPSWILVTAVVGAVALVFTFALSRRILRPVSALTIAAGRLEEGRLDVQVDVKGDDEIAGLARAFNAMAARLGATEQARRQMVTDVAHELRSPVTNLRCTLEAMQDGLAPLDRAAVDALYEETLFLQRLIADLQDLALAEAGRLDLHVRPVDITEIVRRAVTPLAAAPGARITVDVPGPLPALAGDPDRLEQILRNLLTNARRHTPADGTIAVRMTTSGSAIRIVVSDTGRGIEAAHLPHVFDRFYRADASRARATGGAGLGLAIVRQLVAAHHGTVEAQSDGPGRGARFVVVLPLSAG